jgi:hypothetical protein
MLEVIVDFYMSFACKLQGHGLISRYCLMENLNASEIRNKFISPAIVRIARLSGIR